MNTSLQKRATKHTLAALIVSALLGIGTSCYAANEVEAEKLMSEARAKEQHSQQLREQAAAATQKAADDQLEAQTEDRQARILVAQALKLMGADENKQKAFRLRMVAKKLWSESHEHLIWARNAQQQSAQLMHNAEELRKSAAELKDQPMVAATLENEAKEAAEKADKEKQTADADAYSANALEDRAKTAWAEAEKLDPETAKKLAPPAKPVVAPHKDVK